MKIFDHASTGRFAFFATVGALTGLHLILDFSSISSSTHGLSNGGTTSAKPATISKNGTTRLENDARQEEQQQFGILSNPHYGWQPTIPEKMVCSWRTCFEEVHNCSSCRDSLKDWGTAPAAPDHWIPDVTTLHRMMLAGKDANGHPWPPSLDLELCEDIGTDGNHTVDVNKEREYQVGLQCCHMAWPASF
jgi:hypothetical protein